VPSPAKKIYQNAQSLPINAIPSEILKIHTAKPKIQKFGKDFQKYTWSFKDDEYLYELSVNRPFGCISVINLGLQELIHSNKTVYLFIQKQKIPSRGKGVFELSKEKNACRKLTIKNQRFEYLKNGKVPPNNTRDIPEYASMVFELIDSYYNYKRDKVTKKIGLPAKENGGKKQRWSLINIYGTLFEVTLTTVENCDKILRIEWIDKDGALCSLIKESYY
jgi:hypothetical protein